MANVPAAHGIEIRRRVPEVHVLDNEPAMLALASRRAKEAHCPVHFHLADMRKFTLASPVNLAFCMLDSGSREPPANRHRGPWISLDPIISAARSITLLDEDWGQIAPYYENACEMFPSQTKAPIHRLVSGPACFTAEDLPLIGSVERVEGLYVQSAVVRFGRFRFSQSSTY